MSAPRALLSVCVRPGSNRAGVLAALFAAGAQGVQERGDELFTLLADEHTAEAVERAVVRASPDAIVETAHTEEVDWSQRWRGTVEAHDLGPLTVAPPWHAESLDPARTVIIEPAMAFGTGEHETTRGVIRLLANAVRVGDRVADLGAGSAVLAIAAMKLGAGRVAAIELDGDAIGNAEENVQRNGVAGRVVVIHGDAESLLPLVAPVDLVLANIISSVLVSLLPSIQAALAPGGRAILSGMLGTEREDMSHVLRAGGWSIVADDQEGAWWSATIVPR